MKKLQTMLCSATLTMAACDQESALNTNTAPQVLSAVEALRIAQADAEVAYRDLSSYKIVLVLKDDGWHVDYELRDLNSQGGGPHYVIDHKTGRITSKRYEQ